MKILVVDDEIVSREKLGAIICSYGLCDIAEGGIPALRMIKDAYRKFEPYDLITLDLNMPDMSGHVVAQELRQWERSNPQFTNGYRVRILIVTSTTEIRDVIASFDEEAESYIVKPVNPENVDAAMKKIDFSHTYERPAQQRPSGHGSDNSGIGEDIQPPPIVQLSPTDIDPEYLMEYIDSTKEKLDALEAAALRLEASEDVCSITNGIMRTLHSLKGEAGMIGLGQVCEILHTTESAVKAHADDPACADFVLRIKDWMDTVLLWLEDPDQVRSAGSGKAPGPVESNNEDPSIIAVSVENSVNLPPADQLDYSRVVGDFVPDYMEATQRRCKQLEETIKQMQAAASPADLITPLIGILNAMKGEAAMIGLGRISKGINDVEEVLKASANTPKQCAPLLKRCNRWLMSVTDHLQRVHTSSIG